MRCSARERAASRWPDSADCPLTACALSDGGRRLRISSILACAGRPVSTAGCERRTAAARQAKRQPCSWQVWPDWQDTRCDTYLRVSCFHPVLPRSGGLLRNAALCVVFLTPCGFMCRRWLSHYKGHSPNQGTVRPCKAAQRWELVELGRCAIRLGSSGTRPLQGNRDGDRRWVTRDAA
jgi:hypothetical protein